MPVSPRASKEEFMAALGLSTHNPQHEQYYRAMRDEAISTYNHLNEDPSNLLESILLEQPTTKPPYFWHHIRPDRQRWAITEIAHNAGPLTRQLFARGQTTGEYAPNWVAGWLLYSVFRSRDVRNNRNRRRGGNCVSGNGNGNMNGTGLGVGVAEEGSKSPQTSPSSRQGDDTVNATAGSSGKKEYYDPVRNG
ncbi:uncharacterized protein BO80DRAFT_253900 [Aspergillus ibericus CBS 121593]|uniref:Uncharacterized protein n=1 Tax=Aspergillus ibericus CBS 121593 TaxID=1448316 RepID=A0A395H932_9EURO|nr:hypothetical protein BO80DRAFT_253900 [Aspergillus ibericus CBS 121593]RAL04023.1 hypothetical protein BO80DRAFT_253900 [Aspergillus ibericus CBS 121593]